MVFPFKNLMYKKIPYLGQLLCYLFIYQIKKVNMRSRYLKKIYIMNRYHACGWYWFSIAENSDIFGFYPLKKEEGRI